MSANASLSKQRHIALQTRLGELTTQTLIVDCATAGCRGPRPYLARDLAGVYGQELARAATLRRTRCSRCGGLVLRASLATAIGQRNPAEISLQLGGPRTLI